MESLSPSSNDNRQWVARNLQPFADQRGFPNPGGQNKCQFAARSETIVQPLDQAGRRTVLVARRRDKQFGG